jgi:pilus assembly protein CpaF
MSLLKRISKTQDPASGGTGQPATSSGSSGGISSTIRAKTPEQQIRRVPPAQVRDPLKELKERIQDRLISELDPAMDVSRTDEVRRTIQDMYEQILAQENIILSRAERERLFEGIVAEILGFGPLEVLLADDTVSEIMVNGPEKVFVEQKGKLTKTAITFENDEHVMRVIDRIVSPLGRRIDESSPYVDARLPDGSRVNAIIPPLALNGPTLTIRKFERDPLTIDDLVRFGSMSTETAEFLRACVIGRLNIVVSGGTGSGKTTLLNVLSSFIPENERIITFENSDE